MSAAATEEWQRRSAGKGPKAITQPGNGTLKMNETCDRCGPAVRAVYRVTRNGELYLCRHCASQLWPALSAQGWASTVALRGPGRTRARPWSAIRAALGLSARAEDEGHARTRTPD
jgi:ribosomal protein S14